MSQKLGGIAAKVCERFEDLYLMSFVGELLNDEIKSLKSDSFGDPINIISTNQNAPTVNLPNDGWCDVTIGKDDYYIGCQCKYCDTVWTPNSLVANNILVNAIIFQAQNPNNIFRLVARTNAPILVDLIKEIKKFETQKDFESHMASGNKKFYDSFKIEFNNAIRSLQNSNIGQKSCFEFLKKFEFILTESDQLEDRMRKEIKYIVGENDVDKTLQIVSSYFIENAGRNISAIELWAELRKNNVFPKQLSADQFTHSILKLNRNFKKHISPIDGNIIPRTVTQNIINKICVDEKYIALHGDAGFGKSGVLLELVNYYEKEEGIITIPVRLDLKSIESLRDSFGKQSFKSLSKKLNAQKIIFFIDQFDALRWGTQYAKKEQEACRDLIEELSCIENVFIIISCRSYDLETEFNNINYWINIDGGRLNEWQKLKVEKLSKDEISTIVKEDVNTFTTEKLDLLGCINNLKMYLELPLNIRELSDCKYILHKEFLKAKKEQFEKIDNEKTQFYDILDCMVNAISTTGAFVVYEHCFRKFNSESLEVIQSIGLLNKLENKYMFSHQSIYDYLSVTKSIEEILSGTSVNDVIRKESVQKLNLSEKIKLILEQLYQIQEFEIYLNSIEKVLLDNGLRFFIKEVALNVLGTHILSTEKAKELYLKICKDENFKKHFYFKVARNIQAFKIAENEIPNDITDELLQREIMFLLGNSLFYDQGECFLKVYHAIQDERIKASLIERLFNSDKLMKFELQQLVVNYIKDKQKMPDYFTLKQINNFDTQLLYELLFVTIPLRDSHGSQIEAENLETIVNRISNEAKIEDSQVIGVLKEYCENNSIDIAEQFNSEHEKYYFNSLNTLLEILKCNLNKRSFDEWIKVYSQLLNCDKTKGLLFKILSFCNDFKSVIKWLIEINFLSHYEYSHTTISKLIRQLGICSDKEDLRILAKYILKFDFFKIKLPYYKQYGTECLRDIYGHTNYSLLSLLPFNKFDKALQLKYWELKRKFGVKNEDDFISGRMYSVISAIENKIEKLSDITLLNIIFSPNIKKERHQGKPGIESGADSFKNTFSTAADMNPKRFLNFLERINNEKDFRLANLKRVTEQNKIEILERVDLFKLAILNGLMADYSNRKSLEDKKYNNEEINKIVSYIQSEDYYNKISNAHNAIRFIEKFAENISNAIDTIKCFINYGNKSAKEQNYFPQEKERKSSYDIYMDLINNDYLASIETFCRLLINLKEQNVRDENKFYLKNIIDSLENSLESEYKMMQTIGYMTLGICYKDCLSNSFEAIKNIYKQNHLLFNANWFVYFSNFYVLDNEEAFESIFNILIEKLERKEDKQFIGNAISSYYVFYGYFKSCVANCINIGGELASGVTKAISDHINDSKYNENVYEIYSLLNQSDKAFEGDMRVIMLDNATCENEKKLQLFLDFMDTKSFKEDIWGWSRIISKLKREKIEIKDSIKIIDKLCELLINDQIKHSAYNDYELKKILEDLVESYTNINDEVNMFKYINYYDCLLEKCIF